MSGSWEQGAVQVAASSPKHKLVMACKKCVPLDRDVTVVANIFFFKGGDCQGSFYLESYLPSRCSYRPSRAYIIRLIPTSIPITSGSFQDVHGAAILFI